MTQAEHFSPQRIAPCAMIRFQKMRAVTGLKKKSRGFLDIFENWTCPVLCPLSGSLSRIGDRLCRFSSSLYLHECSAVQLVPVHCDNWIQSRGAPGGQNAGDTTNHDRSTKS